MVTFKNIDNIDTLFNLLDGCSGAIYFQSSNGTEIDMRNNYLLRELLASACRQHGIEELHVRVEDQQDMKTIIEYLLYRKLPGQKAG